MHPLPGPDLARSTPTSAGAVDLAASVASGELRAESVVRDHLARIAERDPQVNALVLVDVEGALDQARRVDQMQQRGESLGPLAGVPIVVKDNVDVRAQTTAAGSRAHAGAVALRDAIVVTRLREAGAVVLGRANMDELAMGASTQTSAFGPTRNPLDLRRSPGGSSGGSAAAVADGLATLSVGTDTGGSIREPAAQCGVVGVAPSPGLVPMDGVVPFAPGFDRVGPIARDVSDALVLLRVLAGTGGHPLEATARVGLVRELAGRGNHDGVLARLDAAARLLRELGVEVVEVSVAHAAQGLGAYMALTSAASVPVLEPYVRTGLAGAEVERRWRLGRDLIADGESLGEAEDVRRALTAETDAALRTCDALLAPTMPTTAPVLRRADEEALADPMHAPYTDCWTVVANLTGVPAISLPAGPSPEDGMPVGVQLSGAPGADERLLALAGVMQDAGLAQR